MEQDDVFFDHREDGWRVRFAGELQRPTFNQKGAALAFLSGLKSGYRKPESVA